MQEKLLTSELFNGKKESYPTSVPIPFENDRLSQNEAFKKMPKAKYDIFNAKKYLQNAQEKIQVDFIILFIKYSC